MSSQSVLGYVDRVSPIHRLNPVAKLVFALACILAALIGADPRYLAALLGLNVVIWILSRLKVRDMLLVLVIIAGFMILNNVFIFLFAPEYGTQLFHSRTLFLDGPGRWDITAEQLFYQLGVTLKYFAVLPPVLIFIATTRPPEFAAALNRIGLPYRISYSVSIALRYIPDIQRDFTTIIKAQQARGIDSSPRAGIIARTRAVTKALIPLLLGALDRIEAVASGMELRGFGRLPRRTWYTARPLHKADFATLALALFVILAAVALLWVNGGRFYNPFS